MFYSQAMTAVELVVPSKDLFTVTKLLSSHGVFQVTDSTYLTSGKDSGQTNSWQEKTTAYSGFERRIQSLLLTIGMDEGQPPKQSIEQLVEIDPVRSTLENIELDVKNITDQINDNRKKVENLESIINQLEPTVGIDIDISTLHISRYLYSVLGIIPTANVERLHTSLTRIPYVLLPLSQNNQNSIVWLAGAQNNKDVLERAARSAYLNVLHLPETYQGTPSEVIKSLKNDIDQINQNTSALKTKLAEFGKTYGSQLNEMLWNVRASRMLADAIVKFGQLRYTYLIVGWIPTVKLATLTQQLNQISKETLIESSPCDRGDAKQDVPVSLHNPKLIGIFQPLVTIYSRPAYHEVDPTPLIALTFPILFGLMFGDVGQGLVLVFLGWLLMSRKVKALQGLSSLGGIVIACGIMATIFGVLYGSIFGFEKVIPVIWLHPMQEIMSILMFAIGIGIVLLSAALLIGMYNAWKIRDWGRFFFNHFGLAGIIMYWSLVILVLGVALGKPIIPNSILIFVAIAAALVVMFGEVFTHLIEGHRPLIEGGLGTYFIQAFFELFETMISYLSNSLSYVRVGAFAVAHGALSSVFFILAEMVSPGRGLGYWLVVLIGNIFIIGFEGMIVAIQTMRLSYYEFFTKFFTGGGKRFEPLSLYAEKND